MPREYRHIKDYEREIEELRKEGYSGREIGIKLFLSSIIICYIVLSGLAPSLYLVYHRITLLSAFTVRNP